MRLSVYNPLKIDLNDSDYKRFSDLIDYHLYGEFGHMPRDYTISSKTYTIAYEKAKADIYFSLSEFEQALLCHENP